MKKANGQVRLFLIIDTLILILCIPGIYQLQQKPGLPFSLTKNQDQLIIGENSSTAGQYRAGDRLVSVGGMKLNKLEEIEIFLDSKSVGDNVQIDYLHKNVLYKAEVVLTNYYSIPFIVINILSGIIFILFGIFVLLKCRENKAAKIFHWGSIGVAVMLLFTWGKFNIAPYGAGIVIRIIYQFTYTLTPVLFVWFSLLFPADRLKRFWYINYFNFSAAIIISFFNIYYFLFVIPGITVDEIVKYQVANDFTRSFSSIEIFAAIIIFLLSYKHSTNEVDRKKLKWLLAGFIVGPLIFSILWIIPEMIFSHGLIPEISIPILMTAIPISFTIAIVRYHLMDIDLIIRRSVVYTFVIIFVIVIYIAIISVISSQILLKYNQMPAIFATIIIALLFEPIRKKVHVFVDKIFFRVHYDLSEALRKFLKDISEINTVKELAEIVVKETVEFIPVNKIGFFLLQNDRIRLIAHRNFNLLVKRSLLFNRNSLKSDLNIPIAEPSRIEPGINFEPADVKIFKRWGMELVIPVKPIKGEIYAFLVLGDKKSGNRYTYEDVDLLNNINANIAATMERINIQEELIRKNIEAERLEELNRQKTLFVSTVSHDLKTPLASIKVFSEMMKNDEKIPDNRKKYLDIIEGESDRLTRLIDNVLGYARIESGTKKYSFESVNLNPFVLKTIEILSYQLKMKGFTVETQLCDINWIVSADSDAVTEALINLISNAMKFSVACKKIYLSTFRLENYFCIEVRDKGIGIKPEDLRNLFKPFFRSKLADDRKIGGTGLGLSIIRHVMDAHGGKIEVESVPDEGTAFILKFPIEIDDSINIYRQEGEGISEKNINY